MKKTLLLLLIAFASTTGNSWSQKLSPFTQKFLKEYRSSDQRSSCYVIKEIQGRQYLSALVQAHPSFDESAFASVEAVRGMKSGNIYSVQIPIDRMEDFIHLSGLSYIQIDEPSIPNLDQARIATRADSVHAGINLPMVYNGTGVVMGVVDAGFDFRHPAFLDTSGMHYRVKKVWMQKNTTGPAPSGYVYGTEATDSTTLTTIGHDNGGSHGTHVGGICAGSGVNGPTNNQKYRGMAYESDLVFVCITPDKPQWYNTGVSDMIDGINYIFDYATSQSKPCVVNLSWGSPLGPRDGSGLFSQALDNITGPGRIFVCSAGNNGDDSNHVAKSFTPTDTIVQTFLHIADSPDGKKTWIDMWGDGGMSFCVDVSIYNGGVVDGTGYICLDDSLHTMVLLNGSGDTLYIDITTSSSEFNGKTRAFLDFNSKLPDTDSILISVKSMGGSIDFWNTFVYNTSGYYGVFRKNGYSWAVNGDNVTTISDIASSQSAITVGAYASKVNWTDINGDSWSYAGYVSQGNLVPFSSRGPTIDGRNKPDITGPGLTVGSSISSYDSSWVGGSIVFLLNLYHDPNTNRDYRYAQLSGTSMSSPAVSGITAMMLQADPNLSPQDLKDVYAQTAILDSWTGILPPGGTVTWGSGKINAYGAMQRVLQNVNVPNIIGGSLNCNLFPNPGSGLFTLDYDSDVNDDFVVESYDAIGKQLSSQNWNVRPGANNFMLDLTNESNGIYFVKISLEKAHRVIKVFVE